MIAKAAKSMHTFDLVSQMRSGSILAQLAAVELLPRAKNEVWILGPQTPGGGRRATNTNPNPNQSAEPRLLAAAPIQSIQHSK